MEGKALEGGSSGNDEETEVGSTVCRPTGDEMDRRQGTEDGGRDTRRCTQEETEGVNGVGIIVNVEISKEVVYEWRDGKGASLQYG